MALEDILYHFHRIPADLGYRLLDWTKYDSSRLITTVGMISVNAYLLSMVANSFSQNKIDSIALPAAVFFEFLYMGLYAKNWKRADIEEERRNSLAEKSLAHVLPLEESLQLDNYSKTSKWMAASEISWPVYGFLSNGFGNAVGFASIGFAMLATFCLYAGRYALLTEYDAKSTKYTISIK